MIMINKALLLLAVLGTSETPSVNTHSRDLTEEECRRLTDVPQTRPEQANMPEMLKDLSELTNTKGERVFAAIDPEMKKRIEELFTRDPLKVSKLEQFYGLLFWIGKYKSLPGKRVDFDPKQVRKLLASSKTFSKPDVPKAIQNVTLYWNSAHDIAQYEVKFDRPFLKLELNQGRGFPSFKEGLCQIAEELHFYGGFQFEVKLTRKDNIYISEFKDVDLYGRFGSRGMVNVDINLVTVKSVEFLQGSPLGIVRAKVSRKEFEVNEHSALLRFITHFVTDKSTQPIDW